MEDKFRKGVSEESSVHNSNPFQTNAQEGYSVHNMRPSLQYSETQKQFLKSEDNLILNNMNSIIIGSKRQRKHDKFEQNESRKPTREEQHPVNNNVKKPGAFNRVTKIIKMADMARIFQEKLSCTNTQRSPVSFDPLQGSQSYESNQLFCKIQRTILPKNVEYILGVLKIVFVLLYVFCVPLSLIFDEVHQSQVMIIIKSLAIFFSVLDILELLEYTGSSHPSTYSSPEIIKQNTNKQKKNLLLQLSIVLTCLLSIILTEYEIRYSSFFFVPAALNIIRYSQEEISKFQSHFFTATHNEKYWDIVKVVGINLFIGHLLACLLISITRGNSAQNWMTAAGIIKASWYQQYIWSYYFGTTIILTIGFGDIHASNSFEAFCLIPISFIAVGFFGYNINYIGDLINSIREDEVEKNQKLKIFGSITKKTQVPEEIKAQITNYIIQESQIKKVSNFAGEKKFIRELPDSIRSSFLQQTNKQLFNNLLKMIWLSKKTIGVLSERIETKICHPEQIIKKATSSPSLMILQSGQVGFSARVKGFGKLNGVVLQHITNSNKNQSKLICVDVFTNKPVNYDIKSLSYSIVYYMDKQNFEDVVRTSQEDFQNYRQLMDKYRFKMNQFGLTQCKFCPNKKHTLFECPRLHFTPFRNTLPARYLRKKPNEKQERNKFIRGKKKICVDFIEPTKVSLNQNTTPEDNKKPQECSLKEMRRIQTNNLDVLSSQFRRTKKPSSRASHLQTMEVVNQLREEINKLKQETASREFEFTLWNNSDTDQAHNFTYYFCSNNPCKLAEKTFKKRIENLAKSHKKRVVRTNTDIDWRQRT